MKKVVKTEKAPAAIGPYSQGITANGMLFTSGQIPINPETSEVVYGTIEEQTKIVMNNLGAVLEAAGCSYSNVVKTTCFLNNMDDFARFNAVYGEYFPENAPARSCVAVKTLPKDVLVEVEAVAVI